MDYFIPICIYIVVPIIGMILFLKANSKLRPNQNQELFTLKLLFTISFYTGLLILLLTELVWRWSAPMSLLSIILFFFAPLVSILIIIDSYRKRKDVAEKKLFKSNISFLILLAIILTTFATMLSTSNY